MIIPEVWCYRRIPGGIATTNPKEDGFVWGEDFVDELVAKVVGGGGRAVGTRHKMEDGSVELRSGSSRVLKAASSVLRAAGYRPQRKRQDS